MAIGGEMRHDVGWGNRAITSVN